MSGAYVDADKLRHLIGTLKAYADDIEEYSDTLAAGIERLGESWRDEQFDLFADEFTATAVVLHRLTEAIRNVVPHLEQDAATIERYNEMG